MAAHEEVSKEPANLAVEEMQQALFEHGWEYLVDDDGVGMFSRSYARINLVLQGDNWRMFIHGFSPELRAQAPYLSKGVFWINEGGETEVRIGLVGCQDDQEDVSQAYILDTYLRECGFEEVDEEMLYTWLRLKGKPGAPQVGSRAYYEQRPRAAELRNLSLAVIEGYRQVVSEGIEGNAMASLMELNMRLAHLAIEPDMHTGASPVELVDPVVRAERIAGRLRGALQRGKGFVGGSVDAEEYNLVGSDYDESLLAAGLISADAASAANTLMNLDALAKSLGSDED